MLDINCAIQYYTYKDKHVNIIQQKFGYTAYSNSQTNKAIFLIKDWYKSPHRDIVKPAKNCGRTGRAFQSQLSHLSCEY